MSAIETTALVTNIMYGAAGAAAVAAIITFIIEMPSSDVEPETSVDLAVDLAVGPTGIAIVGRF